MNFLKTQMDGKACKKQEAATEKFIPRWWHFTMIKFDKTLLVANNGNTLGEAVISSSLELYIREQMTQK